MLPHPSPPANLGKMAIRAVLWPLGLCVVCYQTKPCVCFPQNEKAEKGTVSSLVENIFVGLDCKRCLIKFIQDFYSYVLLIFQANPNLGENVLFL
jgi:hypothetical protein